MTKAGDVYRRARGFTSESPSNFGWVVEGKLAGSGMPVTREEFDWAVKQGIGTVVTVREDPLPWRWVNGSVDYLHLRVADFDAPELDDIARTVEFIESQIASDKPVMVHCAAGKGRTGVILACYLVKNEGFSAQAAIEKIRAMRPGSIQSEPQEWAVAMYEKYLKGNGG
ncbi:dual specificity protein phosphatase 23 [Candidatus Nitrososphaera sp. FF02]|uniref:dual specificity protein phosphatase 23 n=1 Tax=Candidatus Nitrososphaera sp. FF02 TaxID=3398226 RepID=UPI0039E9E3BE